MRDSIWLVVAANLALPGVALGESPPPAPTAEAGAEQEKQAAFQHGEAIDAELAGDFPRALSLLREASHLDPKSRDIAFDLARLAAAHQGSAEDLQPFLAGTDTSEPESALRQAIEAQRAAKKNERFRLLRGKLTARLRLGVNVDSNVALTPSDTSSFTTSEGAPPVPESLAAEPQSAVRLVTDGQIAFTPVNAFMRLDVATQFRLGRFLSSSEAPAAGQAPPANLDAFDANVVALVGRASVDLKLVSLNLTVTGTQTWTRGFSQTYLRAADSVVEAYFGDVHRRVGLYGGFGLRNFVDANPEGGPEDRDGLYLNAGFAGDWNRRGKVGLFSRLGVTRENADGEAMKTLGAVASLGTTINIQRLHGVVAMTHETRVYSDAGPGSWSDIQDLRVDNRLSPFARATVTLLDYLDAYGQVVYQRNLSTHHENIAPRGVDGQLHIDRTYQRQVIEIGVEGKI